MQSKLIEYYDWDDIKMAICEEMGIDPKNEFRDYHKVVGGDYKDLWHEWMNFFEGIVNNGQISYNDLGDRMDVKVEWVKESGKEWLVPFVEAVYKVWDKYEIENVKYSW